MVSVGNFMADAVKRQKAVLDYPEEIQQGIHIHRAIDNFTDTHPLFRQGTARLHSNYAKFSPVIMDIFYDHLLAINWSSYSDISLKEFSKSRYKFLNRYKAYLPERTKQWFTYMKMENLLYNYVFESKIEQVLGRMDRRTGGVSGMSTAIRELRQFKPEYELEFKAFFEELCGQDFLKLI